ncbi:MAG: hypothetical protein ACI87T_003792 [Planctomycetota bacterium]
MARRDVTLARGATARIKVLDIMGDGPALDAALRAAARL